MADQYSQDGEPLDIFGSDPFGRNYLYGLSGNGDGQGLAPYGTRYAENLSQPTTAKRGGYYGNIGTINEPMTEFSSAFEVGGKTIQYPLIVPTLTVDELKSVRARNITPEIDRKAQQFALDRLSRGQDPFATTQELRYPQPQGLNPAPITGEIRETPRSPILGLFSDIVNLPLEYMSAPERTQQSQGVAQFLYGTGIPKTLERMSYGESLLSGAGGLGGTTRMRPETAEALMNVAPFAPAMGRLASRAVKATKGMPVGMSIRSVKAPQETALALAQQRAALPVEYPLAPAGTRYEEFGGDLTYMTPDEFLQQVRPLQLDAESLDNIAALRRHVEAGGKLDPLHIYATGKEDGRHRAYLAKELGIEKVPVALHGQPITPIASPTYSDPFGNTIGSSIR